MYSDLISVIIPVYNVEEYLDHCMQCVVNQTYYNLEIILIDDGSTDKSGAICNKWGESDPRIQIIHKINGGLSDARNAGLDICTGKYIVFIDSDDYVHPEYIEYLHHLIVNNQADLSICEIQMETPEKSVLNRFKDNGSIQIMDQKTAVYELCRNSLFSWSACAKMYLASTFLDIRYPVGHIYEDLATTYKLFFKANHIVLGHRALYNYVYHEKSISHSSFDLQKMDLVFYAEKMCNDIVQRYPECYTIAQKRLFCEYSSCLRMMSLSYNRSERLQSLFQGVYLKLIKTRFHAWKSHPSLKQRFYILCSLGGKRLMRLGFQLEEKIYRKYKLKA